MKDQSSQGNSTDSLEVSEIFYSIQGEGPDLGNPIIFIRLVGCNLHCRFCDTPYTWHWKGDDFKHNVARKYSKAKEVNLMSVDQIMQELKTIDPDRRTDLVVVTGGNPLIHQKKLVFTQLLGELHRHGYTIEMEDNGTIAPAEYITDALGVYQYHITPKLANSGLAKSVRDRGKVMRRYVEISEDLNCRVVFKYVISTLEDFEEVLELVEKYNIPREYIWIMPEGISLDATMEKSYWLIEKCVEFGFNFTPRLHIMIWGNKRGV